MKRNGEMDTNSVLREREKTHGDFAQVAATAQAIKAAYWASPNWPKLTPVQVEGLEQIAVKLARILCGNMNHVDSFADIAGYALLIVQQLESKK